MSKVWLARLSMLHYKPHLVTFFLSIIISLWFFSLPSYIYIYIYIYITNCEPFLVNLILTKGPVFLIILSQTLLIWKISRGNLYVVLVSKPISQTIGIDFDSCSIFMALYQAKKKAWWMATLFNKFGSESESFWYYWLVVMGERLIDVPILPSWSPLTNHHDRPKTKHFIWL